MSANMVTDATGFPAIAKPANRYGDHRRRFCRLPHSVLVPLGVRFDMEPLEFYWQYVDPALLQHDLWRSIFYLDQQPPAFNLFLGTILHLAPKTPEVAFHVIRSGIGLAVSVKSLCVDG